MWKSGNVSGGTAFTANIAQGGFSLLHHRIQTFRVIMIHVLTPGKCHFI